MPDDVKLARPNFSWSELRCKCGCGAQWISSPALDKLQALRERVGKPVVVHSAARCRDYNAKVGGKDQSQHISTADKPGRAFDVSIAGMTPDQVAREAEAVGFLGIGVYPDLHPHGRPELPGAVAGVTAILSLLGSRALPYVLAAVAAAGLGGWLWLQGERIEGLQDDLAAARDRAAAAESANADLAAEIMRQATERARTEAALAAERDAALARAASRGRALQEITDAPETADRPFDPGVGAALRRLHTGADR